jgi:hypothetical protein
MSGRKTTTDWATRPLEDELGEALRAELLGWPGVTIRPMFGVMAFYRGERILGCYVNRDLAQKKARYMNRPGEPPLVWVRLPRADVERACERPGIRTSRTGMSNWVELSLGSRALLEEAVRWFGRAYEHAPRPKPKQRRRTAKRK